MSPDDKLDNDATAVAETEANGKEAKAKKGFPSFVIYIVIALIMAGAGYFVGGKLTSSSGEETEVAEVGKKKDTHGERAKAESFDVYLMEDIIVNPSGTGGTRFLSVSIGFEVSSERALLLFEKREPVIKDALITILGSKTLEQLSDTKEKEITRYQIKKRIEQLLKTEDVMAVYFTDFILQ